MDDLGAPYHIGNLHIDSQTYMGIQISHIDSPSGLPHHILMVFSGAFQRESPRFASTQARAAGLLEANGICILYYIYMVCNKSMVTQYP